jgi:spore coat polysaccharide biosynthesis protein SpsF (cytidylyltransferase family)
MGGVDVVATENLPFGLNVKAFTKSALNKVHEIYLSKNNDTGFGLYFLQESVLKVSKLGLIKDSHKNETLRLTLDYEEDYQLIKKIIEYINFNKLSFSIDDLLSIFELNSDFRLINWKKHSEHLNRSASKVNLQYIVNNSLVNVKQY